MIELSTILRNRPVFITLAANKETTGNHSHSHDTTSRGWETGNKQELEVLVITCKDVCMFMQAQYRNMPQHTLQVMALGFKPSWDQDLHIKMMGSGDLWCRCYCCSRVRLLAPVSPECDRHLGYNFGRYPGLSEPGSKFQGRELLRALLRERTRNCVMSSMEAEYGLWLLWGHSCLWKAGKAICTENNIAKNPKIQKCTFNH